MSGEVYEIAILGRAVWQLHSLNNEGTVGNVTEPRNIRIIDPNTKKAVTTDGISGEMLKHIHSEIMWVLSDKNNLCNACKVLNPEKFNFTIKTSNSKPKDVENALGMALKACDICDVHGFLVERPTVSRKSTIEFGWALGIPEVYRDIHTHARHALGEKSKRSESEEEGEESNESSISTQMVYHRPTRSGIYAIVSVFQPWRIGLNEARQNKYTYDAGDDLRKRRYETALKAYQLLFSRPEGAMTTTRLPHVEDFEGVIVYSTKPVPVPIISPLKDNYVEEIETIVQKINESLAKNSKSKEETIKVIEFSSLAKFIENINELIEKDPYKIEVEAGEK